MQSITPTSDFLTTLLCNPSHEVCLPWLFSRMKPKSFTTSNVFWATEPLIYSTCFSNHLPISEHFCQAKRFVLCCTRWLQNCRISGQGGCYGAFRGTMCGGVRDNVDGSYQNCISERRHRQRLSIKIIKHEFTFSYIQQFYNHHLVKCPNHFNVPWLVTQIYLGSTIITIYFSTQPPLAVKDLECWQPVAPTFTGLSWEIILVATLRIYCIFNIVPCKIGSYERYRHIK